MKIATLGAGFCGLTAALRLLQQGHTVSVFEKEGDIGGLAGGFKQPGWEWALEKSYHHWFTNDQAVLKLAQELNHAVIIRKPHTDILVRDQVFSLDSPYSVLKFSPLSLVDRIRLGFTTAYLKFSPNYQPFVNQKALPWLEKFMGTKTTQTIWEPLFQGKFGSFKESIALTWFWARIKKRTSSLAYPEGGFKVFTEKLAEKVRSLGGEIYPNTEIGSLRQTVSGVQLFTNNHSPFTFDKVISTLPSLVFAKITPQLPQSYVKKITSIPHLHAQNLILIFKKPFLKNTYWLNITDQSFPFLVLAEHTNFMSSSHYNNQHILYIGNYLPSDHPYLKMTANELLKIFDPYLKKISPSTHQSPIATHLFTSPFAQPVVTVDYLQKIPEMKSPLKDIFVANMDMVYPWDRGTNYAVEMGEKVAELVDE